MTILLIAVLTAALGSEPPLAAPAAQTVAPAAPPSAAATLDARILFVARDAETFATRSGQPHQNVVMEVAKAVRDLVWTSGLSPETVSAALARIDKDASVSATVRAGLGIVEQELAS